MTLKLRTERLGETEERVRTRAHSTRGGPHCRDGPTGMARARRSLQYCWGGYQRLPAGSAVEDADDISLASLRCLRAVTWARQTIAFESGLCLLKALHLGASDVLSLRWRD